jgi:transposase-like protein
VLMRSKRIPAEEQYRLIMECRQSGLTDHQWCVEHDIKPGTFYNWVKRLRQKGCVDLPANYVQTECQFRYCGTAIPFLTVRSTAR